MAADLVAAADAAMREGRADQALGLLIQATSIAPDDADLWLRIAVLYRTQGKLAQALDAANAAVDRRPADAVALLFKASLHQSLDEAGRAAEIYRAAIFHAGNRSDLPPPIAGQLDRARQFVARYRDTVVQTMPALEELDPVTRRRADRFIENVLDRRATFHQEPTHYRYPGLADIEYFDEHFGELRQRLKQVYPAIRQEYLALAKRHEEQLTPYVQFQPGQPAGQWEPLNHSRKWQAFHLCRYGEVNQDLARACPQTMAALGCDEAPDIGGLAPNLMFSVLAPRTRIPPHHGVANFRSVLHLPLIVPPGCGFRVGSDTRQWIEGEAWTFDDTIEHEAWNDSDEPRIILIADLWRPELSPADRQVVREFIKALDRTDAVGAL